MVALLALVSSLVVASSVQAARIPNTHRSLSHRANVPDGWVTEIMEPYDAYHTRYMALDCASKHDTSFFDACCHPMKSNETLATARASYCDPANAATTTSSKPVSTAINTGGDDDDEEDCEDDDDDSVTSAAVAVPTPSPSKMVTSKISKPTTSAAVAVPETTAAPKPATTEAPKPTTTAAPKPTTTEAPKPTTTAASSSGGSGGKLFTGGKGTFFYQNGAAGSCGVYNKDDTPLVAVDSALMKSSLCGKMVLITNVANGKSVKAKIQDTCPTCENANSLDLSVGAFNQIADPATGLIDIKYVLLD